MFIEILLSAKCVLGAYNISENLTRNNKGLVIKKRTFSVQRYGQ